MHVRADKARNDDSPFKIDLFFFWIFGDETIGLANVNYLVSLDHYGTVEIDISLRIDGDDCSVKVQHFGDLVRDCKFVRLRNLVKTN